jgi:microcystin-dependent protein
MNAATSTAQDPTNAVFGGGGRGDEPAYAPPSTSTAQLNATAINLTGGNLPHNNMPPYLVVNFIIAMQGIYPARS